MLYCQNIQYPEVLDKDVGFKKIRTEKIYNTDKVNNLNIMDKINIDNNWDLLHVFKQGEFIPKFDFNFINVDEVKPFRWLKINNFITLYFNISVGNISDEPKKYIEVLNLPQEIQPQEKFNFLIPSNKVVNHLSGISKMVIHKDKIKFYFEHSKEENENVNLPIGQIYQIKKCSVSYFLS
jgi:hypothetical protein